MSLGAPFAPHPAAAGYARPGSAAMNSPSSWCRSANRSASPLSPTWCDGTLGTPFGIGDREIFLKASIGLTLADGQSNTTKEDMLQATPNSRWPTPRSSAAIASRCFVRRCGASATIGSASRLTCGARSTGRRSRSLSAHRPARGPHHRWVRGAAALGPSAAWFASRRRTSSRSRRRSASSSISAPMRWTAPRVSFRPGSRRSMSIRRSSPASTFRAASSCGTIFCRT